MPSNTPNFGLYKKIPATDGNDTFDIVTMLNNNWDAIDAKVTAMPTQAMSRQALINGNFDVWQRGTSFSSGGYAPDRWFLALASGMSCITSQQTFPVGQTDVPNEPTYFARYALSGTPGGSFWISQRIEDVRTFAGKKISVSFYIKASAPISNVGVIAAQRFGSGGSAEVAVNSNYSITTIWQKISVTITLPSVSGKTIGTDSYLEIRIFNGTTIANVGTIDISQVQVNTGDVALPFQPRSIAEELQLCKRYYQTYGDGSEPIAAGLIFNTTTGDFALTFPEMRVAPTVLFSSPSDFVVVQNNGIVTPTAMSANSAVNKKGAEISATVSGVTQGQGAVLRGNNTNPRKITLDAEF